MKAWFRFDPALSPFLDRTRRERQFEYDCARAATFKNAIEALGVPHTEVGALRVNGAPVTLQRIVREADRAEVDAPGLDPDADLRFVADAHLGGLARLLRMLGFDTLHRNDLADDEIRRLAHDERRIVLSRDRELLKCREIERGAYVRALKAEAQLHEIAARYALAVQARPFALCLSCNVPLEAIARTAVASRVPASVFARHERFVRCPGCDGVFWPGSHYERMRTALGLAMP